MIASTQQLIQRQCFVPACLFERLLRRSFAETHFHDRLDFIPDAGFLGILRGKGFRPVPGGLVEQVAVPLVLLRHLCVLRVVRLRRREHGLDREERRADGERGAPLLPQHVQADGARLGGDVGVPDLGVELHLRGVVRVVGRDLDVDVERAPCVRSSFRAQEISSPVPQVVFDRIRDDRGVLRQRPDVGEFLLQPLELPGQHGHCIWKSQAQCRRHPRRQWQNLG
mmetsp:Transcript_60496/g.170450  ORF Transcript_60496/g.170450 Transcript_60496/m.170450 type:complete len:225 (-) Transcript_60496:32-706(-)